MNKDALAQMSVKELRRLAAERGLARASALNKAELVAALAKEGVRPAATKAPVLPAPVQQGSSSHLEAPRPTPAPGGDQGLPIPDRYGRDRLVLLVQDPSHIFAYWEVTGEALDRARREMGETGTAVLLLRHPGGAEQREIDLGSGNWYLHVAPATTYSAAVALRRSDGRLVLLAESNPVTTPAAAPSPNTDESWLAVDEAFRELLGLAGIPGSGGSGERFRNRRELNLRPIPVESGVPLEMQGQIAGAPSSATLAARNETGQSWSSHSLAPSSGALVGLSSGQLLSSGALGQSSHLLSSRALSSSALSSGALATTSTIEQPYPVATAFMAPPTGLPKAAEGVLSPAPAPIAPMASAAPPPAPPGAPASAPPPAADPLAFIGAPKPPGQRKPLPRR